MLTRHWLLKQIDAMIITVTDFVNETNIVTPGGMTLLRRAITILFSDDHRQNSAAVHQKP